MYVRLRYITWKEIRTTKISQHRMLMAALLLAKFYNSLIKRNISRTLTIKVLDYINKIPLWHYLWQTNRNHRNWERIFQLNVVCTYTVHYSQWSTRHWASILVYILQAFGLRVHQEDKIVFTRSTWHPKTSLLETPWTESTSIQHSFQN